MPNQQAQHSATGRQTRSLSADDYSRSAGASAEEQRNPEQRNPEALAGSAHGPLDGQTESATHIQLAEVTPTAPIPQRNYSVEWDPMRYATVQSRRMAVC
jgi:hypothetical protein